MVVNGHLLKNDKGCCNRCVTKWEAAWNNTWAVNLLSSSCGACAPSDTGWVLDPSSTNRCRYTRTIRGDSCETGDDCPTPTPPDPPAQLPSAFCCSPDFANTYTITDNSTTPPTSIVVTHYRGGIGAFTWTAPSASFTLECYPPLFEPLGWVMYYNGANYQRDPSPVCDPRGVYTRYLGTGPLTVTVS